MDGRGRIPGPAGAILAVAALLVLGACQTTAHHTRAKLPPEPEKRRIVLLPPDVELSILHAGGGNEINAEWTRLARQNLSANLAERFGRINARLVERKASAADFGEDAKEVQLLKLHEAVGASILIHQNQGSMLLPTKEGKFDWSLGPEARYLKRKYGADYALFVFMRDSYASSGRVAAMIFAAALGVGIRGGVQLGFSSLVDIETGEVVWFNHLARASGDLRTPEGAAETIDVLLASFPK
jgi:hypothetical protein